MSIIATCEAKELTMTRTKHTTARTHVRSAERIISSERPVATFVEENRGSSVCQELSKPFCLLYFCQILVKCKWNLSPPNCPAMPQQQLSPRFLFFLYKTPTRTASRQLNTMTMMST